MFSLPQKLESAAFTIVEALGTSVLIKRNGGDVSVPLAVQIGLTQEDKAVPSLTLAALNGQEFPQGSGNYTLALSAAIKTNADETTLEAHRALCEAALAPLLSDNSEAQLTAAEPAFGVLGISNRQCNERIEDRSWVTELSFDAYCCGLALV